MVAIDARQGLAASRLSDPAEAETVRGGSDGASPFVSVRTLRRSPPTAIASDKAASRRANAMGMKPGPGSPAWLGIRVAPSP
jgi:hypothetical protein